MPQTRSIQNLTRDLAEAFASTWDGCVTFTVPHSLGSKVRVQVHMERNHNRPHFHVRCAGKCNISVDIETAQILAGRCDTRLSGRVERWAESQKTELLELWRMLNDEPDASNSFAMEYSN